MKITQEIVLLGLLGLAPLIYTVIVFGRIFAYPQKLFDDGDEAPDRDEAPGKISSRWWFKFLTWSAFGAYIFAAGMIAGYMLSLTTKPVRRQHAFMILSGIFVLAGFLLHFSLWMMLRLQKIRYGALYTHLKISIIVPILCLTLMITNYAKIKDALKVEEAEDVHQDPRIFKPAIHIHFSDPDSVEQNRLDEAAYEQNPEAEL